VFGTCFEARFVVGLGGELFAYEFSEQVLHLVQGGFLPEVFPADEFADVSGEVVGAHVVAGYRSMSRLNITRNDSALLVCTMPRMQFACAVRHRSVLIFV